MDIFRYPGEVLVLTELALFAVLQYSNKTCSISILRLDSTGIDASVKDNQLISSAVDIAVTNETCGSLVSSVNLVFSSNVVEACICISSFNTESTNQTSSKATAISFNVLDVNIVILCSCLTFSISSTSSTTNETCINRFGLGSLYPVLAQVSITVCTNYTSKTTDEVTVTGNLVLNLNS